MRTQDTRGRPVIPTGCPADANGHIAAAGAKRGLTAEAVCRGVDRTTVDSGSALIELTWLREVDVSFIWSRDLTVGDRRQEG